jgi:tetratricopeptide (TPR) repeat protein
MNNFFVQLFILLFASQVAFAQTAPPKGAAADKAIAAYSAGNLIDLSAVLPALVKEYPSHPFTTFFKAFVADRKDNNVQEALKGYSEVIKTAPDLMEPYLYRAIIFNEKGMYEKGIEDMTNAIKYDTDKSSNLFTLRGEIYSTANKNEEAFADFKQAIQMTPSVAKNYRGLMNSARAINKKEDAITIIKNAITGSESNNAGVWEVWGDFNLLMKQFKISDEAFDKSFLLDASFANADSYNSAAIAALNVNNFSKAKKRAEQAIAISPDDYHYYNTRSEISISDKTWEEVYTWAQKALQVNAKSARANMLMAIGIKRTNRGDVLSAEYEKKAKQLEADGVKD